MSSISYKPKNKNRKRVISSCKQLIVIVEGRVKKIVPLDDQSILIGTGKHCQITLRNILKRNVEIQVRQAGDKVGFIDINSSGCLMSGNESVDDVQLSAGDFLNIGDYKIVVDSCHSRSGVKSLKLAELKQTNKASSEEESLAEPNDSINVQETNYEKLEDIAKDLEYSIEFPEKAPDAEMVDEQISGCEIQEVAEISNVVVLGNRTTASEKGDLSEELIELANEISQLEEESSSSARNEQAAATEDEPECWSAVSIDEELLIRSMSEAEDTQSSTIDVLGELTELDEGTLTASLGELFDYPVISSGELMSATPKFELVSAVEARTKGCVVVEHCGLLVAAFTDPFDQNLRSWIESRVSSPLEWLLTAQGDLITYISRFEQSLRAMDAALPGSQSETVADNDAGDLSLLSISRDSNPVVKLVHSTLFDALRSGVSDIHLEVTATTLEIRYRIDGVLVQVASVAGREMSDQVISRIKVMAELDISEQRIPQDGRFKIAYEARQIDFRVSIMPSSFGEDAVLRVLDKHAVTQQMSGLSVAGLGFEPGIVQSIEYLSSLPHGMLLVTGPTGSGKTTTLYAALSGANRGDDKIVTIEDPVEYQLPGVLQIPVNERKGLTFARGLRSILRHDPDKIMVGEIRDPETAEIAVQSALTGHLVFTTVHANNVFDVISRFMHMNVDPLSMVSALNGVLAQRLVRVICQECVQDISPTEQMLKLAGIDRSGAASIRWRKGRGCGACRGTGYRGRKAVGELLILNDELREAITSRVPVRRLKELAAQTEMRFLRDSAMNLLRLGETTVEEVNRVTGFA